MRIGIDASRAFVDQPTGTERYAYEMITRMIGLPKAKNHEWVLYVRKGQKPTADKPIFSQANVHMEEIGWPYLWTQVGLAARTWTDGLDILWVPAHTLPVLRKFGLATAVTIHGIEYEWLPAYENLLQRWYLPLSTIYAVKQATKVISVSEFTKKQLIERLKADADKITVVGEGYVSQSVGGKTTKPGVVLKKLGLRPKKYLMFVGTVQPRKNLARLIEVFKSLPKKYADMKLVICGKLGWNYDDVLAAAESVRDRVVVTGYVDDKDRHSLLSEAVLYVQPSVTEGFGLPVLEAMDAGVPVVASRGGALPEVVGNAGLMFDPLDIRQMLTVIESVLGDERLRRKMITAGKVQVKQFEWTAAAKKVLDLLTYNI